MVLLKVVRFIILDQCINVFFNQLEKNLKVTNLNTIPQIGEFYSKLVSKDKTEIFFNCRILDVYQSETEKDFYVDFEYEDYDFIDLHSVRYNPAEDYLEDDDEDLPSFDHLDEDFDDDYDYDDDEDDVNTDTVLFSEFTFIK